MRGPIIVPRDQMLNRLRQIETKTSPRSNAHSSNRGEHAKLSESYKVRNNNRGKRLHGPSSNTLNSYEPTRNEDVGFTAGRLSPLPTMRAVIVRADPEIAEPTANRTIPVRRTGRRPNICARLPLTGMHAAEERVYADATQVKSSPSRSCTMVGAAVPIPPCALC
jgi:hypothetical protein